MVWLLLNLALAGCDLSAPADAPFEVPLPTETSNIWLILEVETNAASKDLALRALERLDQLGLSSTVIVPAAKGPDGLEALLDRISASADRHDLALLFLPNDVPRDPTNGAPTARAYAKPFKPWSRPKAAVSKLPTRIVEAILVRAGYNTVLVDGGPTTSVPRPAVVFDGQPRTGVVLPPGPYSGPCGGDPGRMPFTPRTADRANQTLLAASRALGPAVVRVGFDTTQASDADFDAWSRWLESLVDAGVHPVSATRVRPLALAHLRTGDPETYDPNANRGGRLVAVAVTQSAAESLRDLEALPRTVTGDLTLTEAFQAFAKVLAGHIEGDVVRLGPLAGPRTHAESALVGPTELDQADLVALAKALLAAPPEEVPAALPVGRELLTASEVLLAFASAVRGDSPVTTRPISVPEPNQPGLGWGKSTVP